MPHQGGLHNDHVDHYATVTEVKLLISDAFDKYDVDTAIPRHSEHIKKFDKLFAFVFQMKGAWVVLCLLAGVPLLLTAVVDMLRYIHGK